ncbi:MAG: CDP-glycerol glycerophosphotransferase family protein [Vagococcus sp.]|uniref:CDP-glycerol glycerophosphotransferase family protein n=1 Tax=Vagococcus sp. TaxID=1933889 RepID=UPI002FC89931
MAINEVKKRYKKIKNQLFPSMHQKMRLHYAANYDSKAIDDSLILYETRDGKSIVDSPYAMFLELARNEKYQSYKHLWVVNKNVEHIENSIPKDLRDKVTFITRGTLQYVDAMLEAKYLITNSTFESFFVKREGQIYINTWHGTPLKYMGFDIPGAVNHSQNVLRNFLMTDYILSPNKHTSDIFINSYKLKGIYAGQIVEGGYPRIDFTLTSDKEEVQRKIESHGVFINKELPVLLFSPTWKGKSVNKAEDDIEQIINETLTLVEKFSTRYNVLVKVHPFIFSKMNENERVAPYLVSDLVDANEVLSLVDVLVTDYSSIFFDFLVTKKPIIFYSWDKDLYQENRGMYLPDGDLPGPTAENLDELIGLIENVNESSIKYQDKYQRLAERMTPYDNGQVTKKYIEYIFEKKQSDELVLYNVNSDKKKLVIYPGGMKNNGITSSLLNLVNNIDYDLYDVTIITNSTRNAEINKNLRALNPNARVLFRFGVNILTKEERDIDKKFMAFGVSKEERNLYPEKGYRREMNRVMGNLSFDVAIDFSGYSYFWGRHILATNSKKYVAFMHNDLMSDSMREINGKTPMKTDLHGLFSIYYKFDKLLSVSPMTMDVNFENLKEFVTKDQMSYVYNSINIDQILNSKNIEETKEEAIKISIFNSLKLVKETSRVKSFKNVDAIINGVFSEVMLTKESSVVQHATCWVEEVRYSKVTVAGMYEGWIATDYFIPRPFIVEKIENKHLYGTVTKALHFPIWKELRSNSETDQIVAYARHFKGRYLEVTKAAYTENGIYYLVHYNGKQIGWMSPKPLMRVHRVDPLQLLHLRYRKKMKQMEELKPVVYSEKVENNLELFAKLRKDQKASIWRDPGILIDAFEFPVPDDYYETAFKVNQLTTFSDQVHCRLTLEDGSFVGYINQAMVEMIDENEFNHLVHDETEEYGLSILPKVDLAMQKIPKFDASFINFVNMGRLSPEKNQDRLIEAFKMFNEEVPNSRLYILGKGPLQANLVNLVRELKLEGKVMLLGHITNPFEFMKLTDYFVLPSFYEGQPMVLLESLTIGMKILASNIPANINVVGKDEKYGLLTEGTEVEDIYNGLKRAYKFDGKFANFDYHEYNQAAMDNFYNEIL